MEINNCVTNNEDDVPDNFHVALPDPPAPPWIPVNQPINFELSLAQALTPEAPPLPPPVVDIAPPSPPTAISALCCPLISALSSSSENLACHKQIMSLEWMSVNGIQIFKEDHPQLTAENVAIQWRHLSDEVMQTFIDRAKERNLALHNYINDIHLTQPKKDGYEVFLDEYKRQLAEKGEPNETKAIVDSAEMLWNSFNNEDKQYFECKKEVIDRNIEDSLASDF